MQIEINPLIPGCSTPSLFCTWMYRFIYSWTSDR